MCQQGWFLLGAGRGPLIPASLLASGGLLAESAIPPTSPWSLPSPSLRALPVWVTLFAFLLV